MVRVASGARVACGDVALGRGLTTRVVPSTGGAAAASAKDGVRRVVAPASARTAAKSAAEKRTVSASWASITAEPERRSSRSSSWMRSKASREVLRAKASGRPGLRANASPTWRMASSKLSSCAARRAPARSSSERRRAASSLAAAAFKRDSLSSCTAARTCWIMAVGPAPWIPAAGPTAGSAACGEGIAVGVEATTAVVAVGIAAEDAGKRDASVVVIQSPRVPTDTGPSPSASGSRKSRASAADANRSLGAFDSMVATTPRSSGLTVPSGSDSSKGMGGRKRCPAMSDDAPPPRIGKRPVRASYMTSPRA